MAVGLDEILIIHFNEGTDNARTIYADYSSLTSSIDVTSFENDMLRIDCSKEGDNMELSISDVGKIAGISKDRLRYYEEKGLIFPSRDTDNNYRYYELDELLKAMAIQLYREMDLSVKEIHRIQTVKTIAEMREVFEHRQSDLEREILALQRQMRLVARSIEDCKKVDQYLNKYVIRKARRCILLDKLDDIINPDEYDKFKNDSGGELLRMRSLVRCIELLPNGIGDNSVFVAEESPDEDVECVYTIIRNSKEQDPLMEAYISGMKWVSENKVNIGRYCYIRPLLIAHLGNVTENFVEVTIPLEK